MDINVGDGRGHIRAELGFDTDPEGRQHQTRLHILGAHQLQPGVSVHEGRDLAWFDHVGHDADLPDRTVGVLVGGLPREKITLVFYGLRDGEVRCLSSRAA